MTAWTHQRWNRGYFPFLPNIGGAITLNGMLGQPVRDHDSEPRPEDLADPVTKVFCENVAKRAKPHLRDPKMRYDVMLTAPQYQAKGWPLISRYPAAHVIVYGHAPHPGKDNSVDFVAGPDGRLPWRLVGLMGNFFIYLMIVIPISWLVNAATRRVLARRRVEAGFPVLVENSLRDIQRQRVR